MEQVEAKNIRRKRWHPIRILRFFPVVGLAGILCYIFGWLPKLAVTENEKSTIESAILFFGILFTCVSPIVILIDMLKTLLTKVGLPQKEVIAHAFVMSIILIVMGGLYLYNLLQNTEGASSEVLGSYGFFGVLVAVAGIAIFVIAFMLSKKIGKQEVLIWILRVIAILILAYLGQILRGAWLELCKWMRSVIINWQI